MAFGRRLTCRLQFAWKLRTRTKQLAVRIHAPSYTANWRVSRSTYQDFLACRSHLDTVGPAISPAKCAKVHFGALTVDLPAMVRLLLVARYLHEWLHQMCLHVCSRECECWWVYVYVCAWGGMSVHAIVSAVITYICFIHASPMCMYPVAPIGVSSFSWGLK